MLEGERRRPIRGTAVRSRWAGGACHRPTCPTRLACLTCPAKLLTGRRRPGCALFFLRHVREALVGELLDAAALIGFRRVHVPARVDRDAVQRVPLTRVVAAGA